MNPGKALLSPYLSEREHIFASGPGQWRGVEISLEVLESSLSVLEEEGLEDGVCLRKLFLQGSREEAYLPDQKQRLRV